MTNGYEARTMTTVQAEFERLSRIFERVGAPLKRAPPASDALLASIHEITGIEVDDALTTLWRISNGSRRYNWFADGDDEDFTPYLFLPVRRALSTWHLFAPYDEAHYAEWYDERSCVERDPRVQRHYLRHSKWLAFAECNGASERLQFDADPTSKGTYGQVILCSHDPDSIAWRDRSFLSFFRESNDLLEHLAEDPEFLADRLDLFKRAQSPQPGLAAPETCHDRQFDFDGIRVTWPESVKGWATDSRVRPDPSNPIKNTYGIYDLPFILRIERGHLVFEDDGLEFDYGLVAPGDHIRVAGYNVIYVNGDLRRPRNEP